MVLEDFQKNVWTIVIVLMILGALVLGLDSLRTSVAEDITKTSFTNSSKTLSNGTTVAFTECVDNLDMSVTQVLNGTGNTLLMPGNYTVSKNRISLSCSADVNCMGTIRNVSYSCAKPNDAYNITIEGLKGSENLSGQIGTIGTIIGVAALITIITAAFYFMKR